MGQETADLAVLSQNLPSTISFHSDGKNSENEFDEPVNDLIERDHREQEREER
jgi:hypothetical protein